MAFPCLHQDRTIRNSLNQAKSTHGLVDVEGERTDRVVIEARHKIPKFDSRSGNTTIEARYFDNERYDVGLWCDGLQGFYNSGKYDYYVLLNDSVFALRDFDGILRPLKHNSSRGPTSHPLPYAPLLFCPLQTNTWVRNQAAHSARKRKKKPRTCIGWGARRACRPGRTKTLSLP